MALIDPFQTFEVNAAIMLRTFSWGGGTIMAATKRLRSGELTLIAAQDEMIPPARHFSVERLRP